MDTAALLLPGDKILDRSQVTLWVDKMKISSEGSQVTPPDELIEMVQYLDEVSKLHSI